MLIPVSYTLYKFRRVEQRTSSNLLTFTALDKYFDLLDTLEIYLDDSPYPCKTRMPLADGKVHIYNRAPAKGQPRTITQIREEAAKKCVLIEIKKG